MKLNMKEKKILYAYACPSHHNTVTRLKYGSNFNSIQKYAKKQRKRKCWNRQEARKPEIDMD